MEARALRLARPDALSSRGRGVVMRLERERIHIHKDYETISTKKQTLFTRFDFFFLPLFQSETESL